jgi:hypothetical protein
MGVIQAPVTGSGFAPARTCSVSNLYCDISTIFKSETKGKFIRLMKNPALPAQD